MSTATLSARRLVVPMLALLILASACTVRFNTDVVLTSDDTATVNLVVGVRFEEELPPEATEGTDQLDPESAAEDLRSQAAECGFEESAVSSEEYTEDDFLGVSLTLTDIPVAAVNCFLGADDSPFEQFEIARSGDEFTFTGRIAALNEQLGGLGGQKVQVAQDEIEIPSEALEDLQQLQSELEDAGLEGLADVEQQLDQGLEDALAGGGAEFEASVQITFPGDVGENNATRVEGTTAIWELSADSPTDMMAVGAAVAGGGNNLVLILIAAVALLVLLLIVFLILRSRGKKKAEGAGYGGPPGAQFGAPQGGQYGAPPGGGQQPGQYGAPPGAGQQPGQYGAPPGAGQQPGQYGAPPGGGQQPGGQYGAPPGAGQQPPGGFNGPPGGGQPQQGWTQPPAPSGPQSGQAPQVPGGPPAVPGQGPPASPSPAGGGFDSESTRTFRPEDLLPPEDS